MTHSTHFILRLYGVGHMVKDYSESGRGNLLPPHSFWLTARFLLYAPSHRLDRTYHSLCYTSRGALAVMRNKSMGPPHEGSIWWPIAPWANTLTTELHLAPWQVIPEVVTEVASHFGSWLFPYQQLISTAVNSLIQTLAVCALRSPGKWCAACVYLFTHCVYLFTHGLQTRCVVTLNKGRI